MVQEQERTFNTLLTMDDMHFIPAHRDKTDAQRLEILLSGNSMKGFNTTIKGKLVGRERKARNQN